MRDPKPLRFVTSFDAALFEASGRRCVETFRTMNPDFPLHAYVEEAKHRLTKEDTI